MSKDKAEQKPGRSIEVTYASGRKVLVKRVPTSKLDDLIELQEGLFRCFLRANACLGEALRPSNKDTWSYLEQVCSMLPIVGSDSETLDLKEIEDDWDQLCLIFFTSSNEVRESDGAIMPPDDDYWESPLLAKMHGINFFDRFPQIATEIGREKRRNLDKRREELRAEEEAEKIQEEVSTISESATQPEVEETKSETKPERAKKSLALSA